MGRIKINSSILEEFDAKTFEISKTNEWETILKDKNGIYEGDASTGFKKIEEKNNK